ncbi:hypothetical protein KP509_11G052700 [Ceratopteris richardii]|uniref:AB hydrolase-1 domain-containing protein n=1 Tax=Ceratopteris richardii TaxID=49495 RepID=A0A8T2TSZ3_CERRI|nr:hypothetical protein KP509_11G052700 [Ceratopteris richardii]
MEKVRHRYVPTNGIEMHIAELGSGPIVLLLHGFPEIWYSWRHQMVGLAEAGFHAIAPDFRGYGLTRNTDPSKDDWLHCAEDVLGLLDALHLDKVFIIAKDWGAFIAYFLGYAHPERVRGLAVLGIPFFKPTSLGSIFKDIPAGHYLMRFGVPGVPEVDFARFDATTVVKKIYTLFCNKEMVIAAENEQILDLVKDSDPLPKWMTEEDFKVYGKLYDNSGFGYPIEVPYRCFGRVNMKLMDRMDYTIPVPVLLVMGDCDYSCNMEAVLQSFESTKELLPKLKLEVIKGGSHFVQEQFPEQVNNLIINYFSSSI